jgi:hypothetical protein
MLILPHSSATLAISQLAREFCCRNVVKRISKWLLAKAISAQMLSGALVEMASGLSS